MVFKAVLQDFVHVLLSWPDYKFYEGRKCLSSPSSTSQTQTLCAVFDAQSYCQILAESQT